MSYILSNVLLFKSVSAYTFSVVLLLLENTSDSLSMIFQVLGMVFDPAASKRCCYSLVSVLFSVPVQNL